MDKKLELSLESLNQAEDVNLDVGNGCFKDCSDCGHFDRDREYCSKRNCYTKSYEYCEWHTDND